MKKLAFILSITLAFAGCEPKFDPNAEFKELDVAYGILNPDAEKQYIQIGRAFQTSGNNAEDVAKDIDSTYHSDSILVELIELLPNGNEIGRVAFKKQTFNNREEGIFANPEHYLYTLDSNVYKVKDATDYKLKITNTVTLKSSYADVETLKDYYFDEVYGIVGSGYIYLSLVKNDSIINDVVKVFNANGLETIYEMYLRLPYKTVDENNVLVSRDTVSVEISSAKNASGNYTDFTVIGSTFFNTVFEKIEPLSSDKLSREFGLAYFEARCYGPAMYNYVLAEEAFNSLSQTKPFYSNVKDLETDDTQSGIITAMKTKTQAVFLDNSIAYIKEQKPELGF